MNKINLSKIFLILAIAIISLNLVFAGSMAKRYRISGDLIISNNLDYACQNGGDWTSGSTIEENEYESGTGISLSNVKLNEFFDKLFFAAVPASTCSLEIWSPSGTKVYERSGLNANAIKTGLNEGIVLQNIIVDINSTNTTLNFAVKIKHATAGYLLETTVKVPNINNQLLITADNVDAIINTTDIQFENGIMPVLMLAKNNADGKLVPMWKTIDTFNISEAGDAISQNDLKILDRNMSGKNGWLLSWDSLSNKMKWTNEITTDVVKDGTLLGRDFNPNSSFAEIGGNVIAPTTAPTFVTTGAINYLVFDVNGSTYYIELKKLAGAPSLIELGNAETAYINTNITKVADVTSVTNLNWTVPAGVQLISGQGTNTVVLKGTAYGNRAITLSGISTNNGATISDTFNLNVVDAAYIDAGSDVTATGSPYAVIKNINSSNVSGVTWTASSSNVTIQNNPAGPGKRITTTYPAIYTITVSGTSTVSGNPISDSFIYTANANGGSGGGTGGNGGSNPCFCFKAGTMIDTINGKKAIETLKEGDKVYSYDLDKQELILSTINKMLIHKGNPNKSLKVTLTDDTELYVTENHPIYNLNSKSYKPIGEFTINDRLINSKKEIVGIKKIEQVEDFGTTYNFSLNGELKNYFANGILVHNKDATDLCGADATQTGGGCWGYNNAGIPIWYPGSCP